MTFKFCIKHAQEKKISHTHRFCASIPVFNFLVNLHGYTKRRDVNSCIEFVYVLEDTD